MAYYDIPDLQTWKKDSSVLLARRSRDRVLQVIDRLVSTYHTPGYADSRPELLFYLRSALDFWQRKVNVVPENKPPDGVNPPNALPQRPVFSGKQKRGDAIGELAGIVQFRLIQMHELGPDTDLDDVLFEAYGRENQGRDQDAYELNIAQGDTSVFLYMREDGERRKCKLRFRDGLAWRWYDAPKQRGTGRAEGYDLFDTIAHEEIQDHREDKTTLFAMDRRGRVYAGFDIDIVYFHHSTFLAGDTTLSAGRMRAERGRIVLIESDSGHYKPGHQQMRTLLARLQLCGADLTRTRVLRHFNPHTKEKKDKQFTAAEILGSYGKWPDGVT
jgi:hypothetical protein